MYASAAGKSGGEYYTPREVSELLARITVVGKTSVNKVYGPRAAPAPCCSSSRRCSARRMYGRGFYGQEINLITYNLVRINMFLHDINFDQFALAHEWHRHRRRAATYVPVLG